MRESSDGIYRQRGTPEAGSAGTGTPPAEPTIVIEDEALRRGFTQLPNYLFQVRGLSHSAKLTYALILSYAWQKDYCFPGQETLARDLEVSTRSVIEYLKELRARGLIRIQRRGLGLTNVYHVLRYPPAPEAPAPPGPATPVTPATSTAPPSDQEVKRTSHQGVKRRTHADPRPATHADPHRQADLDVRPTAHDKDTAPTRGIHEETERQHERAAATRTRQVEDTPRGAMSVPSAVPPGDHTIATVATAARIAIAALQAHGIRNQRVLAELVADPGEALAQIERLRQEIERGVVLNPAGWLIEAIRGHYRLGDDGEEPTMSTGAEKEEKGIDDADAAPSGQTAAGRAWQMVCAELRAELTPENYRRWFAPTAAVTYDGDHLTVGVSDPFHAQWLDRRLRATIERAAARVLGHVNIIFVVAGQASA